MTLPFNENVLFEDMDIYYIINLSDRKTFKKIKFPYSFILQLLLEQRNMMEIENLTQHKLGIDKIVAKKLIENLLNESYICNIISDLSNKNIDYKNNILSIKSLLDLI